MAQSDLAEKPQKQQKKRLSRANRVVRTLWQVIEGFHRVNSLAALFEITKRTVFRDLNLLRQEGFSVTFDKCRQYYVLQNECLAPKLKLTLFEAVLLHLQYDKQKYMDSDSSHSTMRHAVTKVLQFIPSQLAEQVKSLSDHMDFLPAQPDHRDSSTSLNFLMEALLNRKVVSIEYLIHPNSLEIVATDISVYYISFRGQSWYVLAWSSVHQDIQSLATEQILSVRMTDCHYEIPKDFTPEKYYKNAWFVDPENGPDWEIELVFSPPAVYDLDKAPRHKTQRSQRFPDGTLKVQFTVSGLHEIATWISGHGPHVKVVSPPELQKMVLDGAQSVVDHYKKKVSDDDVTI